MTLTRAQKRNLDKLATYLENLPEDYRHFRMSDYFSGESEKEYARHNGGLAKCGAVACAVGHGPAAGILLRPQDFSETGFPLWNEYSDRFTGDWTSIEYTWAFCGNWSAHDDHHWGAAARIRYLLKHGEPPSQFGRAGECMDAYREFDKRDAQGMSARESRDPQGLGPQAASPVGGADAPDNSLPSHNQERI